MEISSRNELYQPAGGKGEVATTENIKVEYNLYVYFYLIWNLNFKLTELKQLLLREDMQLRVIEGSLHKWLSNHYAHT